MYPNRPQNFKKKNRKNFEKPSEKQEILLTFDGIPIRKVYVTNLGPDITWQRLHKKFSTFGEIKHIYISPPPENRQTKVFAFITFVSPESAANVLRKAKLMIYDRRIYVSAADSWHQPRVLPDGTVEWVRNTSAQSDSQTADGEQESDEDAEKDQGPSGDQLVCEAVTEDGINRLNDDCLRHIFAFLNLIDLIHLERVCKKWQRVSLSMWRSIHSLDLADALCRNRWESTNILKQFLRRCNVNLLRSINLPSNYPYNTRRVPVQTITKYCPNIETVQLSHLNLENRSLDHLAMSCKKLKSLILIECKMMIDDNLTLLLARSNELNTLDLNYAGNITGVCLSRISGPLRKLSLDACYKIVPQNLISGLNAVSATLTNLYLSDCLELGCNDVSRIVQAVPNLTSLTLYGMFPLFNHKSLLPIGQLAKLEELDLSKNWAVNDDIIKTVVAGCTELKRLNLRGAGCRCGRDNCFTEVGISLLSKLNKLTDLDISYLCQTTNASLKNLTVRSSPPLQRLICVGCSRVSDEGCNDVVSVCNELVLFDISDCDKVTEAIIKTAEDSVKLRTNNKKLKMVVGGTSISKTIHSACEQLHIDMGEEEEEEGGRRKEEEEEEDDEEEEGDFMLRYYF